MLGDKCDPNILFLETYTVIMMASFKLKNPNKESTDTTRKSDKEESVDLSHMQLPEGD